MMVAVAIVAFALVFTPKVFMFVLRWNQSYRMAAMYRDSARRLRTSAIAWREIDVPCFAPPATPVRITSARRYQMFRSATERDRQALKYDRAARYPWLSVAPDPK
jgi:hypothetical protein